MSERDKQIDEIYNIIDELMRNGDLITVDFILKHVDLTSFSTDIVDSALSFLVSTLPVKTKLQERIRMIKVIEDSDESNVNDLLQGLL